MLKNLLNSYETIKFEIEKDLCREAKFYNVLRYIFLNNSIQAIFLFRLCRKIATKWYLKPLFLILEYLRVWLSSCYISSKALIEKGLYLPHATGIVIGSGVRIGKNCTIYQNVTIGRKDVNVNDYPIIGSNVIICAGACIIGNIRVGNNSVVGANAVVISDVPAGSTVVGVPAKVIKNENI
jgi:serine O-acetyltransferase